MLHIATKKLDSDVVNSFEINNNETFPEFNSLVDYIRHRARVLENVGSNQGNSSGSTRQRISTSQTHTFLIGEELPQCQLCEDNNHQLIHKCPKFLESSTDTRFDIAKRLRLCLNCLRTNCKVSLCKSQNSCRTCNRRHHSLLHFDNEKSNTLTNENNVASGMALCSTIERRRGDTVVLGTVVAKVKTVQGRWNSVRLLIDCASQQDYITDSCAKKLNLKVLCSDGLGYVSGFGGSQSPILGRTNVTVHSRHRVEDVLELHPLVVNRISNKLPTSQLDISGLRYLSELQLADSSFNIPRDIDMLIGARSFPFILRAGKVVLSPDLPSALETIFGFVVIGAAQLKKGVSSESETNSFCAVTPSVDVLLTRFWELENVPSVHITASDDNACETIYASTTSRSNSGSYNVHLPFKEDPYSLGNSYSSARRRFLMLERRLSPALKEAYDDVIREHLEKGYLSLSTDDSFGYYIPHHAVIREDKSSTKLRMVLDASAKTDNGRSLNDVLYSGKNLQIDLFTILLNLRLFPVVVSADIKQMYLQIGVERNHRRFQRILYRFDNSLGLQCYEYNCVTFGMRCSPFLALRTIRQLAEDEGNKFPLASVILNRDIYMDDVASSVGSEEEAIELSKQLISIFKCGGFDLVKFSSNSSVVLENIPETSRLSKVINFDDGEFLKILGMYWQPSEDVFTFKVDKRNQVCTKRNILSTIARLWDIMGFVAPVIVYAKLLLRSIWLLKLDWDATPPSNLIHTWKKFLQELPLLEGFKLPRHVGVVPDGCIVTVVGFSDASEKAYGGVIYLHVQNECGSVMVHILCAKSRVAPLKVISLARLELCGILLLSKLIKSVVTTYSSRHRIAQVVAFSDSTVALNWIHSSPHRWETFVANRVAKVQELVEPEVFRHVDGKSNPADCLSRGLMPSQIVNHDLWRRGPDWLGSPTSEWPVKPFEASGISLEEKSYSFVSVANELPFVLELASKLSSWSKLLYRMVYIFRFLKKLPRREFVSSTDLEFVEQRIIKTIQQHHFFKELSNLRTNRYCSRAFQRLKPFLENDIILVGGRLNRSDLTYQRQHPVILPRDSHVVNLIVDYYHKLFGHAGPDLLLSILRQKYWIFAARTVIRSRIHKCINCFRLHPKAVIPEMADLKPCQVIQTVKPFIHTGTDFAGPFRVTASRSRGVRTQKAYVCLFICLTTKSVHIELASDLSTQCFLSAFKRFISRRGPVSNVYSDCGRNYIGARSYLNELQELLVSSSYRKEINRTVSENRIDWHFNAPSAAHFGGAWESNVKTLKTHLFRIIGQQILSFEEMSTVLAQIEAIMNSRPLCRTLSDDPSEPVALTPAHFLNLTPLRFLPAPEVAENCYNLNSRYSLLDKLVQSFWNRWKNEYLHTLQVRQKWNTSTCPVKVGSVVILSTENIPPLHWPLGIIEEVLPGKDGVIRVVKVRTKTGTYLRPTVRLCPLPDQ